MDSGCVTLVVPPRLRLFLPPAKRRAHVPVSVDGTATAGHVLAAVGVPKTEVGALLLDGGPVDLGYRLRPGDRLRVLPVARPQPAPTSPPRFVLDVHLGTLARRMRLLGLDVAYHHQADDQALLQVSLAQQRILLTRDRGLLHRRALRWGAHVNHQDPDGQLREVVYRFAPPLRPWTRCPACNGMLVEVAKSAVQELLPAGTRRCYDTFGRCDCCERIYWRGAHADHLRGMVDAVAG